MDGITLSRDLARLLAEDASTSGFLDERGTYLFLWKSAIEMAKRLRIPKSTHTLTTVASQQDRYKLPADFLSLYMRDSQDEFFIRYYNGSANSNVRMKDESEIFEDNNTTEQSVPGGFCITDYRQTIANVTGSASADGNKANGQCVLTSAGSTFLSTVSAGDSIHNTTDNSSGIVLSVTSNTALVCALFGGTDNEWDSADNYVIVPQRRLQVMFDSPPSTSGHTATVPYVKRPDPVFSHFGTYPFPQDLSFALANYAAWLYKYRDSQPDLGDRWYVLFEKDLRRAADSLSYGLSRKRLKVIMKV